MQIAAAACNINSMAKLLVASFSGSKTGAAAAAASGVRKSHNRAASLKFLPLRSRSNNVARKAQARLFRPRLAPKAAPKAQTPRTLTEAMNSIRLTQIHGQYERGKWS